MSSPRKRKEMESNASPKKDEVQKKQKSESGEPKLVQSKAPKKIQHDIKANGTLLTDEQIEVVKKWFEINKNETRTSILKHPEKHKAFIKKHFKERFDVLFDTLCKLASESFSVDKVEKEHKAPRYYAVYHGTYKSIIRTHDPEFYLLGKGGHGILKYAQDIDSTEWFAYKVPIKKNTYSKVQEKQNEHEASILRRMGQFAEAYPRSTKLSREKENLENTIPQRSILLMELVPGNDFRDINNVNLNTLSRLKLLLSATERLRELHDMNIIHRDIKLDNIMGDLGSFNVRLIDVGLAKELPTNSRTYTSAIATGTPGFLAPETYKGEYSKETDVYAFGVTCLTFLGLGQFKVINPLVAKFQPELPKMMRNDNSVEIIKSIYEFLTTTLNNGPNERPNVNEIYNVISAKIAILEANPEILDEAASADFNNDESMAPTVTVETKTIPVQDEESPKSSGLKHT